MTFNTQISTSVEQSRRLLALGLKKETADMVWIAELGYDAENHRTYDTGEYFLRPIDYLEGEEHRDNVPAWSLHRLIAMCPNWVAWDLVDFGDLYEEIVGILEEESKCNLNHKEYLEE